MTVFGWMIISVLSLTSIFFLVQLIRDLIWNHNLNMFHRSQGIHMIKKPFLFWAKRSYGFLIATMFTITLSFSSVFVVPEMIGDRMLLSAKSVQNEQTLRSLLNQSNQNSIWNFMFPERNATEDMVDAPGALEGDQDVVRDTIGTNTQVEGVDEADILKTSKDGKTIYYASRYFNRIRIMEVSSLGLVTVNDDLDLGELYVDGMYLTDTQLIVIGYTLESRPYMGPSGQEDIATMGWFYYSYTGTVRIYDLNDLSVLYELKTDTNLYHHRVIEDNLFIVSNKYLNSNQTTDLRPQFDITTDGNQQTSYLEYKDIYYFDHVSIYSMTVIMGIKLSNFEMSSQGFLGRVDHIYASNSTLVTVQNDYQYRWDAPSLYQSHLISYDLDLVNGKVNYVGQISVEGHIQNSYWIDHYDGYLRVVTASFWPMHNRLFVIESNPQNDQMKVVGSITENLGKVDETVKSVRFNGTFAYVVTFVQTDPLYTIDLSNPKNPTIIKYEEEPGYSTYLHVWGAPDRLIGLGLAEDQRTLKISAYITGTGEPVDTYFIGPKEQDVWHYGYSEALWNPKAILVDAEKNIFAFPVMTWQPLMIADQYGYQYKFVAEYYIFRFNFDAVSPDDIIGEPIIIRHDELGYYTPIERGTYISFSDGLSTSEIIYTLSYQQMISYDLSIPFDPNNPTYKQVIHFDIEP